MHKTQKEHNRDPIQHIHSFIPLIFSILQTLLTGLASNAICILGDEQYNVIQYLVQKAIAAGHILKIFVYSMSVSFDVSDLKSTPFCRLCSHLIVSATEIFLWQCQSTNF